MNDKDRFFCGILIIRFMYVRIYYDYPSFTIYMLVSNGFVDLSLYSRL